MPPVPEPFHLLIADAAPLLADGAAPPPLPALPQLDALLKRLRVTETIACDDDAPDTPLERALARAHGLPGAPGQVPWAAFETGTVGTPCAWLRPCHWQLGMDHITLLDPALLDLSEAESRALLAAVQPLLQEDGIALRYVRPDAWLAEGELERQLGYWRQQLRGAPPLLELPTDHPRPLQPGYQGQVPVFRIPAQVEQGLPAPARTGARRRSRPGQSRCCGAE